MPISRPGKSFRELLRLLFSDLISVLIEKAVESLHCSYLAFEAMADTIVKFHVDPHGEYGH